MLYLNIQGLTTNLNQLKVLTAAKNRVAVVLSETHITDDISDREINVKGYNIFRCNSHSRHTGGVIFYVKKGIKFRLLTNQNLDKELWFLGIELKWINTSCCVYGIYNQCSETKYIQFLSDFCENELDLTHGC